MKKISKSFQSITFYHYLELFVLCQNFNVSLLYRLAEDFYVSLGLDPLTEEFWERSMFMKPTDRQMLCQPSAWDFGDGEDYRCSVSNGSDKTLFITLD